MIQRVELHGHGTYSLMDGYGTCEQVASRVVELKQTACALTDHGNNYGHVPWQKAAQKASIKPIFGCEFYLTEDINIKSRVDTKLGVEGFPHITILARTQEGYENFLRLIEISFAHFYYYPRIDIETILKYQKGLTILSGCSTGIPTRLLNQDNYDGAYDWIKRLRDNCERTAIELVYAPNTGYLPPIKTCRSILQIAKELNMDVIATGDSHFPRPEDHEVQDLMINIAFKVPVGQPKTITLPAYHYYSSGEDMLLRGRRMFDLNQEMFGGEGEVTDEMLIQQIENSVKYADEMNVEISKAKSIAFPGLGEQTSNEALHDLMMKGLMSKLCDGKITQDQWHEYHERAEREFQVIADKGFSDYMLAVADVCNWAKERDTLVMCRGSAGGSILLWLIGASETDAIAHDLSFERFYDYTRPDPPDVDMDFETWMRQEIIDYITQKYGEDHCSQILAVSLMRAKVAVADVAQAYCIPRSEYAALSMVLDSKDDDLDHQLEELTDPSIMEILQKHPKLRIASRLTGQARQGTVHAAGMIVSAEPLHKCIAVLRQPNKPPVSSCDKHGAAELGLLKFDFLSVSAFDVLANAARSVGLKMNDLYKLTFDDPKVYDTAKSGDVVGVFQLDGAALHVGRKIGLDTFKELYAASALCRPGASQFVDLYAKNKFNEEEFEAYLSKFTKTAADIIRPTYGVVLYQEQMMAMARQLALFDWPKVHKLRKRVAAASFNGHALDEEYSVPWFEGCAKNGIPHDEAEHWWEAIKAHGIYSFNKSHCVTYAIVSYWMLWIKTYYPEAYYEAYLAQEGLNGKNNLLMKRLIVEWRKDGKGKIQLVSKDKPTKTFKSHKPGIITGGWANLAGIGEAAAELITKNGPYSDWRELSKFVPRNVYGQLVETGLTQEMRKNTGKMLHLAPWYPVTATNIEISTQVDEVRDTFGIIRPGELPLDNKFLFNVKTAGYVSTRWKKPRTGAFKGDTIIYTIEDESGIVTTRVSSKKKDVQVKVYEAWEVGDYVIADGFWTGEGTFFVANFITVKKWNE